MQTFSTRAEFDEYFKEKYAEWHAGPKTIDIISIDPFNKTTEIVEKVVSEKITVTGSDLISISISYAPGDDWHTVLVEHDESGCEFTIIAVQKGDSDYKFVYNDPGFLYKQVAFSGVCQMFKAKSVLSPDNRISFVHDMDVEMTDELQWLSARQVKEMRPLAHTMMDVLHQEWWDLDMMPDDCEHPLVYTSLPVSELASCWGCGKKFKKMQCCSKCKEARYCSKACQVSHWQGQHKFSCKGK